MKQQHRQRQGFTLVELVVVIGILSFLIAIVLVAINPAKQLSIARDTQRRADTTTILSAINQYLAKNGALPSGITTTARTLSSSDLNICSSLVTEFVASLPIDPSSGSFTSCSTYDTGYTVVKTSTDDRVTVSAPHAETINISATR
jgi:prepilin-type N-terminal cleavage/methylation domain-containing protein